MLKAKKYERFSPHDKFTFSFRISCLHFNKRVYKFTVSMLINLVHFRIDKLLWYCKWKQIHFKGILCNVTYFPSRCFVYVSNIVYYFRVIRAMRCTCLDQRTHTVSCQKTAIAGEGVPSATVTWASHKMEVSCIQMFEA